MWARGLKLQGLANILDVVGSRSMWARGLKPDIGRCGDKRIILVALHVGAWIETIIYRLQ